MIDSLGDMRRNCDKMLSDLIASAETESGSRQGVEVDLLEYLPYSAIYMRDAASLNGSTPTSCLDETGVARMVDGTGDAPFRSESLVHLQHCGPCRQAIASVSAALSSTEIDDEICRLGVRKTTTPRSTRKYLYIAGLLAASVAGVMVMGEGRGLDPQHRDPTTAISPRPVAVAPIGVVGRLESFTWGDVPEADRYEVVVYDGSGIVQFRGVFVSTAASSLSGFTAVPGQVYSWRVRAHIGFDRWVESDFAVFSVEPVRNERNR